MLDFYIGSEDWTGVFTCRASSLPTFHSYHVSRHYLLISLPDSIVVHLDSQLLSPPRRQPQQDIRLFPPTMSHNRDLFFIAIFVWPVCMEGWECHVDRSQRTYKWNLLFLHCVGRNSCPLLWWQTHLLLDPCHSFSLQGLISTCVTLGNTPSSVRWIQGNEKPNKEDLGHWLPVRGERVHWDLLGSQRYNHIEQISDFGFTVWKRNNLLSWFWVYVIKKWWWQISPSCWSNKRCEGGLNWWRVKCGFKVLSHITAPFYVQSYMLPQCHCLRFNPWRCVLWQCLLEAEVPGSMGEGEWTQEGQG